MTGNELLYERIGSDPSERIMARPMTQGEAFGVKNSNPTPGYAVYYRNGNSCWLGEELFNKKYKLIDDVKKYYQKSNPLRIITARKLPEPVGISVQCSFPGYQIYTADGESFRMNGTDFERQFQEMEP